MSTFTVALVTIAVGAAPVMLIVESVGKVLSLMGNGDGMFAPWVIPEAGASVCRVIDHLLSVPTLPEARSSTCSGQSPLASTPLAALKGASGRNVPGNGAVPVVIGAAAASSNVALVWSVAGPWGRPL